MATGQKTHLFNELREAGLNLMQIGEIFSKNHATIIHGLRVHKELLSVFTVYVRYGLEPVCTV